MSDMTTLLKEHPAAVGALVLGVVVIAYMQSRNDNSGVTVQQYSFRGNEAAPIDPNAAAISEAAIGAGVSNLGTIAQLIGLTDTNRTALTGSLAQTSAARDVALYQTGATRDVALAQTDAAREVSLSNIAASLRASLFGTEASRDVSLAQTAAGERTAARQTDASVSVAQMENAEQLYVAGLNADAQRATLDYQRYVAKLNSDAQLFAIQADKDKARAAANAGIVNGIVGGLSSLAGFFL